MSPEGKHGYVLRDILGNEEVLLKWHVKRKARKARKKVGGKL